MKVCVATIIWPTCLFLSSVFLFPFWHLSSCILASSWAAMSIYCCVCWGMSPSSYRDHYVDFRKWWKYLFNSPSATFCDHPQWFWAHFATYSVSTSYQCSNPAPSTSHHDPTHAHAIDCLHFPSATNFRRLLAATTALCKILCISATQAIVWC